MKIAVVLFGQPRYLQSKASSISHKFWIRGKDIKYFGHVWFDQANNVQDTTRIGAFVPPDNTEELIRSRYKEISLRVEKPKSFLTDELLTFAKLKNLDREDIRVLSNTFSQLYSIHQALKQLNESSEIFDLVVLTRWDNFVYFLPPIRTIRKDKLSVAWALGLSNQTKYGIPDLFLVGPKHLIEGTDAYPLISELLPVIGRQSAEIYKWQSFLRIGDVSDLSIRRIVVAMLRDTSLYWPFVEYPLYNLKVKLRPKTRLREIYVSFRYRLFDNNN